jgi:hypothetical protein
MLTIAAGARRRIAAEHNGRAWLAWNIVALDRARKLPPLKSLLIDADRPQQQARTWSQQLAVARQLAGLA